MSKLTVKNYMASNKSRFVDPTTDEVNCTNLAESAADNFNLYEEDYSIPEWVFEMAAKF